MFLGLKWMVSWQIEEKLGNEVFSCTNSQSVCPYSASGVLLQSATQQLAPNWCNGGTCFEYWATSGRMNCIFNVLYIIGHPIKEKPQNNLPINSNKFSSFHGTNNIYFIIFRKLFE